MEPKPAEIATWLPEERAAYFQRKALEAYTIAATGYDDYGRLRQQNRDKYPMLPTHTADARFAALDVAKECVSDQKVHGPRAQMFAALAAMAYAEVAAEAATARTVYAVPPF